MVAMAVWTLVNANFVMLKLCEARKVDEWSLEGQMSWEKDKIAVKRSRP
jgi:hypothetical protein